jgi:hypothetical protein
MKYLADNTSHLIIRPLLDKYGLAVLPNHRTDECREIHDTCKKAVKDNGYGFGASLRYTFVPTYLRHLFGEDFKRIADVFYGKEKYALHHEVFITNEFKPTGYARNGDLHFDRLHTLKFFYYLTDVEEDCGPLSVVPGTHTICSNLRLQQSQKNYNNIKNRAMNVESLKKYLKEVEPIVGKAGTLIIFDTDVLHCGGHVAEGKERLILRSHCRAKRWIR